MAHFHSAHSRKRLRKFNVPFSQDVRVWRERQGPEDQFGVVRVNVARTCILHSPDGFECGYGGSGPAELALNILNAFVPPRRGPVLSWSEAQRDDDPLTAKCGIASRFALTHHQEFKREFIATMDREGGYLRAEHIRAWIAQRAHPAAEWTSSAETPNETADPRPTFEIVVRDGVVCGVRVARGSVVPQTVPRFVLREYESDGSLERERVSGVDAEGKEYHQHELELLNASSRRGEGGLAACAGPLPRTFGKPRQSGGEAARGR
jgi:hypothetical protein